MNELSEISIMIDSNLDVPFNEEWLGGVVERALTAEGITDPVGMELVITGDAQVQQLNRLFRGLDEPTDVLSFAAMEQKEGEDTDFIVPPGELRHLGEVIISYPQTVRQAAEQGHPTGQELALLIVHGVLHLLGYDHDAQEPETEMKAREAAILAGIGGYPDEPAS
jgi:probable rRNA maturation factor